MRINTLRLTIAVNTPPHPRWCGTDTRRYLAKWRGIDGQHRMPAENCQDVFFSWFGSFFGILIGAMLHFLVLDKDDMLFLVAGFGASSVTPHFHTLALVLTATKTLLYAAPKAPMAQPWNVIGGNTVSAFAGVTCRYIINQFICNGRCQYLGCAFAVSLGESFDRFSCRAHKHLCFHSFSKLIPFTTPCSNPLFHPYLLCIAIVGMKVTRSVHPPGGAMVQNLQTLTFLTHTGPPPPFLSHLHRKSLSPL